MANRRMFSNRIANSAKFLQMPAEAQWLYFHMILRADDDGVVESYPLMRLLGAAPDNFKILVARGFIHQLNEDQVIVITDWLEHNVIRADRKVDTIYKHLLPTNVHVIAAKPRSDVEDNSRRIGGQSTDGISKVRLGKDRLVLPASREEKIIPIDEDGNDLSKRHGRNRMSVEEYRKVVAAEKRPTNDIMRWSENRTGRKFTNAKKQLAHIANMLNVGYTVEQIQECWERLENDEYWGERGFDFGVVSNEISKARKERKYYNLDLRTNGKT